MKKERILYSTAAFCLAGKFLDAIPEENNSIRTNERDLKRRRATGGEVGKKKIARQTIKATSYFGNSSVVPGFI